MIHFFTNSKAHILLPEEYKEYLARELHDMEYILIMKKEEGVNASPTEILNSMREIIEGERKELNKLLQEEKNEVATLAQEVMQERKELTTLTQEIMQQRSLPDIHSSLSDIRSEVCTNTKEIITLKHTLDTFDPLKNQKSITAGNSGEIIIENLFQEVGFNLSIENTGKTKHCGDLHVIDPTHGILYVIEVKNYSRNVPRKEIDKFKRDMQELRKEYKEYKLRGMFLSMRSNLTHHGEIWIDESGDIYLGKKYIDKNIIRFLLLFYSQTLKEEKEVIFSPADLLKSLEKLSTMKSDIEALKEVIDTQKQNIKILEKMYSNTKEEFDEVCKMRNMLGK